MDTTVCNVGGTALSKISVRRVAGISTSCAWRRLNKSHMRFMSAAGCQLDWMRRLTTFAKSLKMAAGPGVANAFVRLAQVTEESSSICVHKE